MSDIDLLCIDTIRTLSIDAVQTADSGHPAPRWAWRPSPASSGNDASAAIRNTISSGSNLSMPSWDLFESQRPEYKDEVLRLGIAARVALEQAATMGGERSVGQRGAVIGMHSFGAPAPLKAPMTKFGFTLEHMLEVGKDQIARHPPVKDVTQAAD